MSSNVPHYSPADKKSRAGAHVRQKIDTKAKWIKGKERSRRSSSSLNRSGKDIFLTKMNPFIYEAAYKTTEGTNIKEYQTAKWRAAAEKFEKFWARTYWVCKNKKLWSKLSTRYSIYTKEWKTKRTGNEARRPRKKTIGQSTGKHVVLPNGEFFRDAAPKRTAQVAELESGERC